MEKKLLKNLAIRKQANQTSLTYVKQRAQSHNATISSPARDETRADVENFPVTVEIVEIVALWPSHLTLSISLQLVVTRFCRQEASRTEKIVGDSNSIDPTAINLARAAMRRVDDPSDADVADPLISSDLEASAASQKPSHKQEALAATDASCSGFCAALVYLPATLGL